MPSAFGKIPPDMPFVYADPGSDLDYSLATWLEGLTFSGVPTFTITPNVAGALHNPVVNAAPVTIDGVTYQINELATVWIKSLVDGSDYTVNCAALFSGGQIDERSFIVKCRQR